MHLKMKLIPFKIHKYLYFSFYYLIKASRGVDPRACARVLLRAPEATAS